MGQKLYAILTESIVEEEYKIYVVSTNKEHIEGVAKQGGWKVAVIGEVLEEGE